jgi:Sulfotransferase domain
MNELQVIGAGLCRTGTLSLKLALESLGFGPCYHMSELLNDPSRVKYWRELHRTGSTDFAALFAGFRSSVDYPGARFYKELLARNPDARVILTLRDPESWYKSTLATVYANVPVTLGAKLKSAWQLLRNRHLRKAFPVLKFTQDALWNDQFGGRLGDRAHALNVFEAHTQEVRRVVPAAHLLVFDVREGWDPLCRFLDVPVPKTAFPRSNERDYFLSNVERLLDSGQVEIPRTS